MIALQHHNDHLREVVENASQAVSIINEKHKRYLDEIEAFKGNHSKELQEIKRISGVEVILLSFDPILFGLGESSLHPQKYFFPNS